MTPVYADHVDRAARAAALILTLPPPTGAELESVRALHDDLARALGEATRIVWLSALGEPRAERERAGIPAAHEMLQSLEAYPRLAASVTAAEAASNRWAGRPAVLDADTSSVGAWKVLAAETFLARSSVDQMSDLLTTPVRAAVLDDLAAAAAALAMATADLAPPDPALGVDPLHEESRRLASASERVRSATAWAAEREGPSAVPAVTAGREPRRVELVRQHSDVALGLANLARITATGHPHAAELFATIIVLGTVADAAAAAMDAARGALRLRDADALGESAAALTEYRQQLARLLRAHQPKLASIGPGNPAALAQARELRTAGVPRLQDLTADPARAAAAAADLRRIGAALAPATAALRNAFSMLEHRGGLLAYDFAPGPGFHWRAATIVDVEPLVASLDAATLTVGELIRQQPATASSQRSLAGRTRGGSSRIIDLAAAINRREAAHAVATSPPTPSPARRPFPSTPNPPASRSREAPGPLSR